MKHISILIVLVLAFAAVGQDVQHAPTVAQCQADQRLWMSKIQDAAKAKDHSTLPTYDVVDAWSVEMMDCMRVDPDNYWKYYNTAGEVWVGETMRMEHFLRRNQMWQKFLDEDAAGKR